MTHAKQIHRHIHGEPAIESSKHITSTETANRAAWHGIDLVEMKTSIEPANARNGIDRGYLVACSFFLMPCSSCGRIDLMPRLPCFYLA